MRNGGQLTAVQPSRCKAGQVVWAEVGQSRQITRPGVRAEDCDQGNEHAVWYVDVSTGFDVGALGPDGLQRAARPIVREMQRSTHDVLSTGAAGYRGTDSTADARYPVGCCQDEDDEMRGTTRARQPRHVSIAYGAVALGVLAAVAAFALVVSPPEPPAVAEFAPSAQESIDDAPLEQSSRFGRGAGGAGNCAGDAPCDPTNAANEVAGVARTPPSRAEVQRARVRRCVGQPPRQTEDPQSPPCVNYFDGDNGGATSKGVTRDEIRVASTDYTHEFFQRLVDHFNTRYEFYGRKIRLVRVARITPDQRATAAKADEIADPFAGFDYAAGSEDVSVWQRELARRRIVTVVGDPKYASSDDYRRLAPFAWSYSPTIEEVQRHAGRFVCTSLAGRQARFAAGAEQLARRKFAVFVSRQATGEVSVEVLQTLLRGCAITDAVVYRVDQKDPETGVAATNYTRLRREGVTSIIVLADQFDVSPYMLNSPPGYRPEWVITGVSRHDNEANWAVSGAAHRQQIFGTWTFNKLLPPEDTPAYVAQQDLSDANRPAESTDTRTAAGLAADPYFQSAYRAFLLLASGIQLAGPNLTPESFAAGLQGARFPNPNPGRPPAYQARVAFGPGDFTMTGDAAVVWWSETAPTYGGGGLNAQGGFCYVDKGVRFDADSWRDVESDLFDADPSSCR